jgi:propanediol dehydratase large subunit
MSGEHRSERFRVRATAPLRRETLISPEPALGLIAMNGPGDPRPSLLVEDGVVTELDGKPREQFDTLDRFIAAHGIDLTIAPEAMALSDETLARLLVDVDTPRAELVRLARGLTPAKLAHVAGLLDPVEMMFALKRLRARRAPANQAHVTNLKESPALLAADAAEAALRGFAECETTVGVSRYAPLNAIALLVGSQTGRSGVMTQCAVEERLNLRLAIQGLVTYAETLSVYGTDKAFEDGDDTPWSKAFLASAYASRGVKVRFTSGTGSEALMGHSEGCSMLALEARCLSLVRACGSQGVQNGAISCVALTMSLPGGTRAILAENLIAAWLDLEVASGNDAIASHSPTRRTAKLMGQFLPGTDFVTSGYSVMPRHDNTFGGGNYDADDLDEWMTLQRDWQVDAGIEPATEDAVLAVRERAGHAIHAVFDELGFPPVSDEEVAAATTGHSSHDLPDRDRAEDVLAADRVLAERITAADVALALDRRGFTEVAERVVGMQRQRVSADYLQTSAVIDAAGAVHSAVNDPNDYRGPGTGYRLEGDRWALLQALPHELDPATVGIVDAADGPGLLRELGASARGGAPDEVVVAVGPAFGGRLRETIGGIPHEEVLRQICAGIEEEGVRFRVIRVGRTSDVAFIAHDGAQLAGSGVAIGLQSKGTAVIHRADLQPLDNLELFGMAPLLRPDSYRQIGRNAARYANGGRASPVPLVLDNFARAKLIVRTTLLHRRETEAIEPGAPAMDVTLR